MCPSALLTAAPGLYGEAVKGTHSWNQPTWGSLDESKEGAILDHRQMPQTSEEPGRIQGTPTSLPWPPRLCRKLHPACNLTLFPTTLPHPYCTAALLAF